MSKKDKAYEITRQNYNKGADWHSEKFADYNWAKQIERFHQALPGAKVLDAGCGNGRDVQAFLEKGLTAEGLDYSGESIRSMIEAAGFDVFHEETIADSDLTGNPAHKERPDWICVFARTA